MAPPSIQFCASLISKFKSYFLSILGIHSLLSICNASTLIWDTSVLCLEYQYGLPAGLPFVTLTFLQSALFSLARVILCFDKMYPVVSFLCLKSFSGFPLLWVLSRKQTRHELQALACLHLPIPTALISSHTTLHFELQPHQSLVTETITSQGLHTYCFLYQEPTFSLPLSLLPEIDSHPSDLSSVVSLHETPLYCVL